MRKLFMLVAVLAAIVVPTASRAQFTLGARVGYGIGLGDVGGSGASALAMSDWVKGQVPLQLDAMYRFTPEIAAGLYFSYGFGLLNSDLSDACDAAGGDCSGSVTRLGVQATYTFLNVSPTFLPWAGVGFGYEWNTLSDGTDDITFKGFEYVNLQLGGDYKLSPQFAIGPFVQFAIGQYDEGEVAGTSGDITDKSMHEWLQFGIRGKFDL